MQVYIIPFVKLNADAFSGSPIYTYDDRSIGKTVTNLNCGDAKLLLIFCEYNLSDGIAGHPFLVVRGLTWQFVSCFGAIGKTSYFDFSEAGILNQHDQREFPNYGDFNSHIDTNTAMVVRRIYKLA